jgi:general secretion pathway protein A
MYTTYFGFQEEPFSLTPTSRLFYSNPVYEGAYNKLMQGIRERQGFLVLTGEVGTGKTTLIRRLIDHLQADTSIRLSFSYYSTLTFEELISFACRDLGVTRKNVGELQAFSEFLTLRSQSGGTTVLVIDEAQDIEEDVLEHLFRLADSPHVIGKLLQVVLVGQHPELDKKLSHSRFDSLRNKVLLRCQLEHLKPEEVWQFIYHRLRLVGYEKEDLFGPDVVQLIATYSTGIPRLVNLICDNALRTIQEAARKTVSPEDIQEVITTLRLRGHPDASPDERQPVAPQTVRIDVSSPITHPTTNHSAGGIFQSLAWGGAGFLFVVLGFLLFNMMRQPPAAPEPQTSATSATRNQQSPPSAVAQQTTTVAFTESLDVNSPQIRQGQTIITGLQTRYPNLRPIAWGLATATPAIALIIPETEWHHLSKEEQINLTLYLESIIPGVRTNPDPYVEEFRSTSVYETFRKKLAGLCTDCWIVGTGRVSGMGKKAVFDKVIVQGNSLWENAPREGRGVNALTFRETDK